MVTGASGTLGFNIVKLFAGRYKHSRITAILRPSRRSFFREFSNVTVRLVEVTNSHEVHQVIAEERPDVIVHCAASGMRPSDATWFDMVRVNVAVAVNLFEASCALPDCHFIHVSTGMVYRVQQRPLTESDPIDPTHLYGVTKAATDMLLRSGAERLGRRLTVVRPFSFTGPHDLGERLFPSLLRCAQTGEAFEMSAGTQIRDYCAVQDVARAISLVLERSADGAIEVYNVGSGRAVPLRRLVEEVCEELALHVDVRFGTLPPHPLEPMHLVADATKLRKLGWIPQKTLAAAVRDLAVDQYPDLFARKSARAHG